MNVPDYYLSLYQKSGTLLEASLADPDLASALAHSHSYINDFETLRSQISQRPEAHTISLAVKEYQFALFAVSLGQYRHAFAGLRLFFELALASIEFSAREIDYKRWANRLRDISWQSICNQENGVFSVGFMDAFDSRFREVVKQFGGIAQNVYRECSEYVHGNAHTHSELPSELNLSKDVCMSWHDKANTMRMVFTFAFTARYISSLTADQRHAIEAVVLDAIGNLPIVQAIFSNPE